MIWPLKFVEAVSGESESVIDMMREQWQSMAGMAAMFVGTIAIGLFIQPLYNVPEARAFGEEGTTKSSFILFELIMIGVFTVVIIWLARKGMESLIKGIVMFALWMSLFYSIQPFSLIALYLVGLETATSVGLSALVISVGAMVALHKYPEWWVVNSVGVSRCKQV